jgi:hypothetical protein
MARRYMQKLNKAQIEQLQTLVDVVPCRIGPRTAPNQTITMLIERGLVRLVRVDCWGVISITAAGRRELQWRAAR